MFLAVVGSTVFYSEFSVKLAVSTGQAVTGAAIDLSEMCQKLTAEYRGCILHEVAAKSCL